MIEHAPLSRIPVRFWRVAALMFAVDWTTKFAAARLLMPNVPVPIAGRIVRLTVSLDLRHTFWLGIPHTPYIPVPGGAPVFYLIKVMLLCVMGWIVTQAPLRLMTPLAVLIGAALGNTVEQIVTGAVINMFDVGIGSHRWPTFNVADAALITMGFYLAFTVQRETIRERGWRRALLSLDGRLPRSLRRRPDEPGEVGVQTSTLE